MRTLRVAAVAVLLSGASVSALVTASPAAAQTTVNDETELRDAVADPAVTEIVLGADIELTDCGAGQLDSMTDLVVNGGAGHTIAQTCDNERIFDVVGALAIEDLTLTGGSPPSSGGAIFASGSVTVTDSTLEGNTAGTNGAAIFALGDVTVTRSTFADNEASSFGGAILTFEDVTVTDSTFADNQVGSFGGAIAALGAVTVSGSTLDDNASKSNGGAIGALGGVTVTDDSTLTDNSGVFGGAIFASGGVTVSSSTLNSNTSSSSGGAILASGEATVSGSTLNGNTASDGGAVAAIGDVSVTGSTLAGNTAETVGGAIFADGGDVALTNVTVTGNYADVGGGVVGAGGLTLLHSTVVGNVAPTTANVEAATLVSFGSVVALPVEGLNCSVEVVTSEGYNFSDDDSCELTDATDTIGGDPGLEDLTDNGGPTETRLPVAGGELFGSPIPAADCHVDVAVDQRGEQRPQGNGCTIGSVEVDQVIPDDPTMVNDEAELRDVVADPAVTEIVLGADIELTDCQAGQLDSMTDLVVDGAGHTIAQTCDNERIFDVVGALTIEDLTLTGGSSPSNGGAIFALRDVTAIGSTLEGNSAGNGGAIASAENVTVTGSTFADNQAGTFGGAIFTGGDVTVTGSTLTDHEGGAFGGAIAALGDVTVSRSTLEGNTASSGGAIGVSGHLTITDSTLKGNAARINGGVIRSFVAGVTVSGSTLNSNTAGTEGGAVDASGGNVTLTNTTVTGNHAGLSGGGVRTWGVLTLLHSTVVGNVAPTAANLNTATLASFGSVVALPVDGLNCFVEDVVTTEGYNFSDDDSCELTDATDTIGGDPGLEDLTDNGGPTETRLPVAGGELFGSPIPAADCHVDVAVDQRGEQRPQGNGCTIGSVEVKQKVLGA